MNRKVYPVRGYTSNGVYFLAGLLILVSLALAAAKVIYGGQSVRPEAGRRLWRINIVMNLVGKGERAKVRLTLPKDHPRQAIYNEHFENDELNFYVRERPITGNRIGFWRSELLDGRKNVQYTFSAQLKNLVYTIPETLQLPDSPETAYAPEFRTWLDPSVFIQSKDPAIKTRLKKVVGRERRAAAVVRYLFDYVRGEVRYKSEKGSKDAKATLKLLEADCGGKARLFSALSRAAGIPSRIVGGIVLTGGMKTVTHVWTENFIGGTWIPFDAVNNHFASIPNDYIELYRGDYFLFKHVGLAKFDYFFVVGDERLPPVDYPWSLYVLPMHFQNSIKVLLLIPIGALVVAFFRTVVGVPTFGTFTPILLALAFREISLQAGLLSLSAIIFLGWALRKILDELKILVIPRLSIIVTVVVGLILAIMIFGFRTGHQRILYVSLFPMVIMTWIIERFSVLQVEDGTRAAVTASIGTALVATAAYFLMKTHELRTYLFAFPELLLAVIALLLLLGRYTGIRVTELWRFREFLRARSKVS